MNPYEMNHNWYRHALSVHLLLMSSCRGKSISIGFTNQMRAAYYSTCKIVNAQKRSQQRDWHFQSERCASYVMGRLGFNLVRAKEKGGDCESTSTFAGENDEEEDILQTGKYVRHQEPVKKVMIIIPPFRFTPRVEACDILREKVLVRSLDLLV